MKRKQQTGVFRFKMFLPYIWNEKWLFLAGILMMSFTSLLRLLDPLIIGHILDYAIPNKDLNDLYLYAGLFIATVVVSGIFMYLQIIVLSKLGLKIITKLKYDTFDHLLNVNTSFYDKWPIGEFIARIESGGETIRQLFSELSVAVIGNLVFFTGMLVILFVRNWNVSLILMIPISLIITSVFFVTRYLKKFYDQVRVMNGDLTSTVTEYLRAVPVVQLFNQEEYVAGIIDTKGNRKRKVDSKANFIEFSLWGMYGFTMETLLIILIIYLMVPKIMLGAVSLGTLVVFVQYSQRIFAPLLAISENINQLQRGFVTLQRIYAILSEPRETPKHSDNIPIHFNDKIEFKNVWFQYKENEWVLKDINLTINKGEKVALVGASGSGKTTVISLISGFYKNQKGEILVDGKNIKELNISEWRKNIGLVLQDAYLFPGNILENVRVYNDEITEEQVVKALKVVNADSFVDKMRSGIYSKIKERGANISAGEKQLLSFARAIVSSPELVILDEATSSVDIKTEAQIQKATKEILKNKTAIVVAHRLLSIVNSDKIILFQNGNIIAQGTHQELLNTCEEYQKLINLHLLQQNHRNREDKEGIEDIDKS